MTDLRETDTGPGGMYSRMEEIGYRLHFEETVTSEQQISTLRPVDNELATFEFCNEEQAAQRLARAVPLTRDD